MLGLLLQLSKYILKTIILPAVPGSPDTWVESQLTALWLAWFFSPLSLPLSVFEIRIASAEFRAEAAAGMYEDLLCSTAGCIIDSNGCKIQSSGAGVFIFLPSHPSGKEFDQWLSISVWY